MQLHSLSVSAVARCRLTDSAVERIESSGYDGAMVRVPLLVVGLLMSPACGGPASTTTAGESTTSGTSQATSIDSESSTSLATDPVTGEPTTSEPPSTTATATTSDSETSTDPFLPEPDYPSIFECDTFDDDCPPGQKCMPYNNDGGASWNATKCFDIMGTGTHGDPCTVFESAVSGRDDCAARHMCWDVDPETLKGGCIAFCDGSSESPSCAPEMTSCVIPSEGVLNLCLPSCDLLIQDCPEGQGCYVINDSTSCAPVSVPPDQGLAGDNCEFVNSCQPGLMCLDGALWPECEMSSGCCAPVCDLSEPECLEPGTECVAVLENPAPWMEHYGVCALPV